MKSRFLVGLSAITCLAALTMPIRLAAQDKAEADRKHHHYKLIDVGTLGGPESFSQEGNAESASAVLWENENGQIVALNTLVAPGSGLALYWARYINDRGEISAYAADSNGNNHDVLLIPCDAAHPSTEGCDYTLVDVGAGVPHNTHNGALPKSLMRQLNRHEGANRRPMQDAHPTRGMHQ